MPARRRKTVYARESRAGVLERNENVMLERLVRLEERQTSHIDQTRTNFDTTLARLSEQNQRIEELTSSLNRYKGFWGAVTLLGSAIATTVLLLKEWLLGRLGN